MTPRQHLHRPCAHAHAPVLRRAPAPAPHIAGPPSPPLETSPSTFISKSSVSGSISGSDGKVFDDTIASAPPRNAAPASSEISVVDGVSLDHTGTLATSFTTSVTIETCAWFLPRFEPMSLRSMCGQLKFSSNASAPA